MPLSLFDLENDRRTVTLHFGDEDLTVTYRPNALTPAREMAIMRRDDNIHDEDEDDYDADVARMERNITRQVETFLELVEGWDFQGPLAYDPIAGQRVNIPAGVMEQGSEHAAGWLDERGYELRVPFGQTIPLNPENLVMMPSNFLIKIVEGINKDMRPDPKRRRR